MTDIETMRDELAAILEDAAFARSPVLARLLAYLVETTIAGRGAMLKSYSVAVDGLGRSPDFDAQVDTYARVQVARLRKALDVYYATAGADRTHRLQIAPGSYEVKLVAQTGAPDPPVAAALSLYGGLLRPKPSLLPYFRRRAVVLGILLLLAVIGGWWWKSSQVAKQRWRASDFPLVEIRVLGNLATKIDPEAFEKVQQGAEIGLSRYEGMRVKHGLAGKSDFLVDVDLDVIDGMLREDLFVVEMGARRILWSTSHIYPGPQSEWIRQVDDFHRRVLFMAAHASGPIHSSRRRFNSDWSSPYGCWLRFTEQSQNGGTFDDGVLQDCARSFYRTSPDHPVAAAMYGWTMVDKSMTDLTEASRKDRIKQAIDLLERAESISPASPLLKISQMRAYSFAGEPVAMKEVGGRALALNPDNLDLKGVVGLNLALWNDPEGVALLREAVEKHFNPPPWYHIGLFIDAMMRNDTATARSMLREISGLNHSLAVYNICSAALEARTGNLSRARVIWDRAKDEQPLLRFGPERLFERMPMAPAVRGRFLEWLSPITHSAR